MLQILILLDYMIICAIFHIKACRDKKFNFNLCKHFIIYVFFWNFSGRKMDKDVLKINVHE